MKKLFFCCSLFCSFFSRAQVQENFSDNNFTANPAWMGDDSVFTVVDDNGNLKLRSNKLIASSTFWLTTANTSLQNTQFEFNLQLAFATSGSNFADVYLAADQSDLLSATLNGYFVRMGGTTDEISLYKTINGTSTEIIDGTDAVVSSGSNNNFRIKVICSASGDWSLFYDNTGMGNSYIADGTVNNSELTSSAFFGIRITQSTASFFQKHFLDSIYVGPIILDLTPPDLVSATALDATHVDVLFSENVDQATAENTANYALSGGITVSAAVRDGTNPGLVHLTTGNALANGTNYTLTVTNVSDLNGNALSSGNTNFALLVGEVPAEGDLIITEFFCDPSPSFGLPEIEFVEIYNKSGKVFHLEDWQLGDNATSGTISDAWILPGEYKVLCPTSAVDSFPNSIAVSSFPSLNNSGDNIVLRDTGNVDIDSLTYTDSWYHDEIKAEGGYTIERINFNDPCSNGDNWSASAAASGGTPGSVNSVVDNTPDTQAPAITSIDVLPPHFIVIHFSEGMDSLSLVNSVISVSPSLGTMQVYVLSAYPDSMTLQFAQSFSPSQSYQLQIFNVADCWNNMADLNTTFIMADEALPGDLVINEILADPYTGGSDFVEIRNNSTKVIDLYGYSLANYDDTIANIKTIAMHFIIPANDFAVITADSGSIKQFYPAAAGGKFIQMSLPSYSNDSATVYLLNTDGVVVDKVSYTGDWQFALLDDTDGKSLERIDPYGSSDDINNWHTASENVGFATPGRENSQLLYGEQDGVISLTKDIFSPDNDGNEDVLQINYEMINAGMLATLSIFDDRGREVKKLVKSQIIGSEGSFTWDGINDNNQKASIGTYVLFFDAFDLAGNKMSKKLAFVLAGQL
ncbi:MAG: lamin tail domain-containing protein [Bacteroidota bacterium]